MGTLVSPHVPRILPVLKRMALPLAIMMVTAGCSEVPDAVNPVEWYRSTADFLVGDDEEPVTEAAPAQGTLAADRGKPAPGANEPFPNLATVPARPQVDSAESRKEIAEGLVADRQQARYSSEVIRRQGETAGPLTAAAPVTPRSAAPEPVAPRPTAPQNANAVRPPPLPTVQPAPAPQRVAALPETPPAPVVRQPAAPTSVSDVFRSRIAEQNRLPSQMASEDGAEAQTGASAASGAFDTVVISSGGVVAAPASLGPPSSLSTSGGVAPYSSLPRSGMERVATIIFSNGSSSLSGTDRKILADVLALHRQRGGTVHVVGHASSRTRTMDPGRHQQVNLKISTSRADAVVRALTGMGLPRNAIRTDARADSEPLYYEVMPTGEAGNRRAEIYLES